MRLYLARCIGGDPKKRDHERLDVRWLPFDDACSRLKYPRDRELLIDARILIETVPTFQQFLKE